MKNIFRILWESYLAWALTFFILGIIAGIVISLSVFKSMIKKNIKQGFPMINDFSEEKINKIMKNFENFRIPKDKKD